MIFPDADHLIIYFFGPGRGESILIGTSDNNWIAIDSYQLDGASQPLAFCKANAIAKLDAFLLTHGDLDHVGGASTLIQELNPTYLFYFPFSESIVDIKSNISKNNPDDARMQELTKAITEINLRKETNHAIRAGYGQSKLIGNVRLDFISPIEADTRHANKWIEKAVDRKTKALGRELQDWANNNTARPGERDTNPLSVGTSIKWGDTRLLFCSDIKTTPDDENRGWSGIINCLERDENLDYITDVDIIKLAHHGSSTSHSTQAWRLHAKNQKVTTAITSTFTGSHPIPDKTVLEAIKTFALSLIISNQHPSIDRARFEAGWTKIHGIAKHLKGASCAIRVGKSGEIECFYDSPATSWKIMP